jgi:hypothetical protein
MTPIPLVDSIERTPIHSFQADVFIQSISDSLNVAPQIIFLVIQVIIFVLLGMIAFSMSKKKVPIIPIFLLASVSLYEFSYILHSIRLEKYPYDLGPAAVIGVTGIFLLTTLKKKPSLEV